MVKQRKPRGATPKAEDRTWFKKRSGNGATGLGGGSARSPKQVNRSAINRSAINRSARQGARSRADNNIIYGQNPVLEYLRSGTPAQKLIISSQMQVDTRVQEIISEANAAGVQIYELPKSQIDKITNFGVHQGVVLYSNQYKYADLHDVITAERDVVVLDHITDPHNFGAVIRSCAAFGVNIVIPNARSVEVNATVWKTSAGNAMKVKIAQVPNLNVALEKLKKQGYFVLGLDGEAEYNLGDSFVQDNKKVCFVAGNEGSGISALVKKNCDALVKIPTAIESLNVSAAVAIALYSRTASVIGSL